MVKNVAYGFGLSHDHKVTGLWGMTMTGSVDG